MLKRSKLTILQIIKNSSKVKTLVISSALAVTLCGCQSSNTDFQKKNVKQASQRTPATVVRVIDGDTFIANTEGRKQRIRLLLVDTPETVHPNKPVQPFGKEASDFSKKTLKDQKVQLEFDKKKRDRYGRLLAYVYLKDGTSFNQTLLVKGFARVTVFPPNEKHKKEYKEAEKKAKQKHRGLWGIND